MFDWFSMVAAGSELPMDAASELQERGFIVLPGPVPSELMALLADAYTATVAAATSDDTRIGSTSTRVSDFVNRGAEFDDLYVFPPLLEACCRVISRPFKLSSLLGRTAALAPRRVHSSRRACRDRLRRPYATRDASATRPTRAVCARALTGRLGAYRWHSNWPWNPSVMVMYHM